MGKIVKFISSLVLILIFVFPLETQAIGLGIHIPTIGSGTTTLEINGVEYPVDLDNSHFGFGFILDTKVANPGVFHYRLHLGFESFNLGEGDFSETNNLDDNFSRFSIDNTFGFAVVQSRVVRLWLGPQIRLSYMGYSNDFIDINLIGFGLAPVLGANFNIGRVFTLAPELGYRFSVFTGTSTYEDDNFFFSETQDDWTLNNREFFFKLNIIFRISDEYF